jgi:hypothetical protein
MYGHLAKAFQIPSQRPTPNVFPLQSMLGGGQPVTAITQVSRLYLGGTFYLLEMLQPDSLTPEHALECEGHEEDFTFETFVSGLMYYAMRVAPNSFNDCLFP